MMPEKESSDDVSWAGLTTVGESEPQMGVWFVATFLLSDFSCLRINNLKLKVR